MQLHAIKKDLTDCLELQNQLREGFNTMSESADILKEAIASIGNDVEEIDGDLQEVLDKLQAFEGQPTQEEIAEITAMVSSLKDRTRAVADKVPEPEPPVEEPTA